MDEYEGDEEITIISILAWADPMQFNELLLDPFIIVPGCQLDIEISLFSIAQQF